MTCFARMILVSGLFLSSITMGEDLSEQDVSHPTDQSKESELATSRPTTQPVVHEDARVLLEKFDRAYTQGEPLRFQAKLQGQFDVAGMSKTYSLDVTGYTDGSGLFRHEIASNRTLVQTSDRLILFDQTNYTFGTLTRRPARLSIEQMPNVLCRILMDENPALLACVSDKPSAIWVHHADSIRAEKNDLIISEPDGLIRRVRFHDDGQIQSVETDYSPYLKKQGVQKVTSASVVVIYQTRQRWKVDPEQFRYEVPYAAMTFPLESELMRSGSDISEASSELPLRGSKPRR